MLPTSGATQLGSSSSTEEPRLWPVLCKFHASGVSLLIGGFKTFVLCGLYPLLFTIWAGM